MSEVTNAVVLKSTDETPLVLPAKMDKVELFNKIQDTTPINELVGKTFTLSGIIPEMVEVNKYNQKELKAGKVELDTGDIGNEMVERMRLTLITDVGTFHSFSITFNKALIKAINVFGMDEFQKNKYEIIQKSRGSGDDVKAFYVLKVVTKK